MSATVPTVVYTPTSSGTPHAFLYNEGLSTVWLGGPGVSSATGLPLAPNGSIHLPYAGGTIYAVSGYNQVSPSGTIITATSTYPAGTALTTTMGTAFTAGIWLVVESGTPRQELAQVLANNAGSAITAAPLQFAHGTATTFSQITAVPSVVKSSDIGAT